MMSKCKSIIATIVLMFSLTLHAQTADEGTWISHQMFGTTLTNVIDAGENVYYLVNNSLYCFNKATHTNTALSKQNRINDLSISNIYYNSKKGYVVITYSNSNIDIIKRDGTVVNLSDIKDAVLNTDKGINDITFGDAGMYVATDFGYMLVDDNTLTVKELHHYSTYIRSVAQVGKWLIMCSSNTFYYSPITNLHETLASFKSIQMDGGYILPINETSFFLKTGWFFKMNVDEAADGTVYFNASTIAEHYPESLQDTKYGYVANFHYQNSGAWVNQYLLFDFNGNTTATLSLSENELYSSQESDGSWWILNANGLRHSTESTYYKPNGLTVSVPFWMTFNERTGSLYVANSGTNAFFSNQVMPTTINTLKNDVWTDVTPTGATFNGTYWPEIDPDDPNTYFLGSWWYGAYKITNNACAKLYDWTNSPLVHALDGYYCHAILEIDRRGNLWVVQDDNTANPVMVLPAAARKVNNSTASDWYTPSISGVSGNKRAVLTACRTSDIKVYTTGNYQAPLVFWNDGGNIEQSAIASRIYSRLTDQDNRIVEWNNMYCLTEDSTGLIWVGTNNGVLSLDPTKAFDSDFTVTHVKQDDNNGKGYLLDGIQVNAIAVDAHNRKWIATNNSGLLLVSADGSTVINQFTTINSYLTSNQVYNVCVNSLTGAVYVITSNGFVEYRPSSGTSTSTEIKATPNPVRPDFTGFVAIEGLDSNQVVDIVDAKGVTVATITANSGRALWDRRNASGTLVPTGRYQVVSGGSNITSVYVIR